MYFPIVENDFVIKIHFYKENDFSCIRNVFPNIRKSCSNKK